MTKQSLLRSTGCLLALGLSLSAPVQAATLSHSGTFADDGSGSDATAPGDSLSLTNSALSDANILTVVINLTLAANAATTWDPTGAVIAPGYAFVANVGQAAATGFTGQSITGDSLTMTFTDFNAGETFSFTIDLDDNNRLVTGGGIAGSQVTATFDIFGGSDLTATIADAGGNTANWTATVVPEPATFGLLSLGLTGLAWGGRRR